MSIESQLILTEKTLIKPLKVVAFDPGETTGYSIGDITTDGLMKVSTGQSTFDHLSLWRHLHLTQPDVIIYEGFEYRNRARPGLVLYSRELIGVMELYAKLKLDRVKVYRQQPGSVINQYFDSTKLKQDKLYRPGNIHANEACMHLLHWFTYGPGYQYNLRGYEPAYAKG